MALKSRGGELLEFYTKIKFNFKTLNYTTLEATLYFFRIILCHYNIMPLAYVDIFTTIYTIFRL